MTRTQLPARRPSETCDIAWSGRPLHLTLGFDETGAVREVFAGGPKEGSDLAHLLSDLCVIISVALQHGVPVAALGKSLGAVPIPSDDEAFGPASVAGLIIAEIEARQ